MELLAGLVVMAIVGCVALAILGAIGSLLAVFLKVSLALVLFPLKLVFGFVKLVIVFALGMTIFAVGIALFAALLPFLILAAIVVLPLVAIGAVGSFALSC